MGLVTVLYYTANVEEEVFAQAIRANLLQQMGNLPLVSVSQKPLPGFGHNICVGQHDACYANEYRQIAMGLAIIKTPYVLTAEADVLYPPKYFSHIPQEGVLCARYGNVWVHYAHHRTDTPRFYFKGYSDGAQCMDRRWWLQHITKGLHGRPQWAQAGDPKLPRMTPKTNDAHMWTSEEPIITFKTPHGVRPFTQCKKGIPPQTTLPFWGDAATVRKEVFL